MTRPIVITRPRVPGPQSGLLALAVALLCPAFLACAQSGEEGDAVDCEAEPLEAPRFGGEGWKHGNKEHPVLYAGRACGAINTGVHERVPDGNLSMAHVTALRALGITTPSYGFNGGETSEHLAQILA